MDKNPPGNHAFLPANAIKLIAAFAMLVNHAAFALLPASDLSESTLYNISWLIGSSAAPTFFYFAVEGYHHTRSVKKYILRLAVFAAVSWLPFQYFVNGGQLRDFFSNVEFSVINTILFGVLAVHIRRTVKNVIAKAALVLLMIALSIGANWAYGGVIIILVFDFFYGSFKKQAIAYTLLTALWVFVVNRDLFAAGMFLPIIWIYLYTGKRGHGGKFSKWFFYIFYPGHLLALGLLAYLM